MKLSDRLPAALRQAGIYAFSMIAGKAIAFAMVPVFTHHLEPADYGRLDILQTLANLLSIIIGLGTAQVLFRFGGQAESAAERREVAATIFGMAAVMGALSLAVTQALAPVIADLLPGGVSVLQVRLILGSLAVTGFILVPMSWMRMSDRPFRYMGASLGYAGMQAMLSVLLLSAGYGIDGVLAGGLIAAMTVAMILTVLQWRDTGIRFDWARMPGYLHFGLVMVGAGIAAFVMDSFNRWILGATVGPAEMALFALAAKFGLMTAMASQPFELWWLPRQFRVLNGPGGETRCARTAEIGLVLVILAAAGVAAIGPATVVLLTPEDYHGAVAYIPAFCGIAVLAVSGKLVNLACISRKNTVWPLLIDGGAAAVAFVLFLLLIPVYGTTGAITATVVALCVRLGCYLVIGRRIRVIPYRHARLLLLSLLLSGILVLQTGETGVAGSLVIGLAGGIALLAAALMMKLLPVPAGRGGNPVKAMAGV